MKLVLSTAWFPMCLGVYLLRAARRAGHEVRTVGTTTGDRQDWEIPCTFKGQGVWPDVRDVGDYIDSFALRGAATWCDLWIDIDGGYFLPRVVSVPWRVVVVTDPHVGEGWDGARARGWVDKVYMMQSPYMKPGDGWLPWAYDPEWHKPVETPQDYDVTNLGAPYPERVELTEALQARGLRVLGPGRATMGPEYARQLCRAPVAVVWPLKDDLPARVFEALACGRYVLTKNVPDFQRACHEPTKLLVPGESIVCCGSVDGLVDVLSGGWPAASRPIYGGIANTWDERLVQLIEGRNEP